MLNIAVISDTHLGFAHGTPRGEDAFNNCKQAFQKALDNKADLILMPGDIFHDKIPKQEVLAKAIELFSSIKKYMKNPTLITTKSKDNLAHPKETIPPIISIYGTHERRHSDATNPVHLLEKAGLVYNLHAESILIEQKGDRLGLHGLSGVPENYAKQSLTAWNPEPFKDTLNLLMVHQNFKELIPELDTDYMELSDLPKGFNIYILGHIHWNMEFEHPLTNVPVLVPGSTVKTQLTSKESEKEKGIYILSVGRSSGNVKFIPIETRPLYYHKITINKEPLTTVLKNISKQIKDDIKKSSTNPLIRFKIDGTTHEKDNPADLNFKKLLEEFQNKAIISIDKSKLHSSNLTKNSKLLVDLRENKISIEELGLKILHENLKLPIEQKELENIFNLLAEQNIDKVEEIINSKKEIEPETDEKNEVKQETLVETDTKPKLQKSPADIKKPVTLEQF